MEGICVGAIFGSAFPLCAQEKSYFKGGRLLANYVHIGRETVDLDFLDQNITANEETLKQLIEDIAQTPVDDGISFCCIKSEVLSQPHMPYPGYRFSLEARLANTRTLFQIDVG